MIGYDPAATFSFPTAQSATAVLARVNSVLVDSSTRPIFGPLDTGRVVEIDDRKVTIGGQYALGTGFMGLGVALASTANFARLFPQRGSTIVNLGAIRLKAGVDPDRAAGDLPKLTGTGTRIFTRQELAAHETAYGRPARRQSRQTGILISSCRILIVYQIVSTLVVGDCRIRALVAIGYPDPPIRDG